MNTTTTGTTPLQADATPNRRGYAPSRWVGDLCIFAGIIASPEKLLKEDMSEQASDIFKSASELLRQEDLTLNDVVNVCGYIGEASHFAAYDAVWRKTFATNPPTRTTVGAEILVKGALIELTITAARRNVDRSQ